MSRTFQNELKKLVRGVTGVDSGDDSCCEGVTDVGSGSGSGADDFAGAGKDNRIYIEYYISTHQPTKKK